MKVNIQNIKTEVIKLNKLIEEYENNYLNLYNEITKASSYWQDNLSVNFFSSADYDKLKIKMNVEEIKSMLNIYQLIIDRYQKLGDKIEFNLGNRNKVNYAFDCYIAEIDSIIRDYRNLDLSFCTYERRILNLQRQKFQNIKDTLLQIRSNVKKYIDKIEEIEKEISFKISELNIEVIKENDISEYV